MTLGSKCYCSGAYNLSPAELSPRKRVQTFCLPSSFLVGFPSPQKKNKKSLKCATIQQTCSNPTKSGVNCQSAQPPVSTTCSTPPGGFQCTLWSHFLQGDDDETLPTLTLPKQKATETTNPLPTANKTQEKTAERMDKWYGIIMFFQ